MCGLVIEHDGQHVTGITRDKDDPLSRGHLCPKAFALRDIYEDPDRLRQPQKRVGSTWTTIGWEQAFDEVAERLNTIAREHGRDAIAVYQGNPTVHNLGSMLFAPPFVRSLGTRNRFSATSVDQLPHHFASHFLFGHQLLLPVPDIDRTQHMLILGANPLVSNGSLMTAPGMRTRLKALQERGGTFTVVDPRRTETAKKADRHHFIVPGRDGLLLAALLDAVWRSPNLRKDRILGFVDGIEELAAAVAAFSAEVVQDAVGIGAADIRRMAEDLLTVERAVVYGRMGVCTAPFGALNLWLITALNIVTGNFDRPGGLMFPTPAVDICNLTGPGSFGRWKSRVRGLPEFGGELPVAVLAEEIETEGEGQVRALITSAGNPVLSNPEGKRLGAALKGLDFMVSVDIYRNETTQHADYILPPRTGLEVPHYDVIFHALAVRNTATFADPLFEAGDNTRTDAQIFAALGKRIRAKKKGLVAQVTAAVQRTATPIQQLDVALRRGPYGKWGGRMLAGDGLSLDVLRANPSGVDLGPLRPQLPERLFTRDQGIDLAQDVVLADFARLGKQLEQARSAAVADGLDLRLVSRRGLQDCNSWLHNAPSLMKGRDRCTLLMHPEDAAARGVTDGDRVTVKSRVGEVVAPVKVSDEMMPGVVCLPHGYGHSEPGAQLQVAQGRAGVSVNDLTETAAVDALSGNAAFAGVLVGVVGV